jgi:hypothetical protein
MTIQTGRAGAPVKGWWRASGAAVMALLLAAGTQTHDA